MSNTPPPTRPGGAAVSTKPRGAADGFRWGPLYVLVWMVAGGAVVAAAGCTTDSNAAPDVTSDAPAASGGVTPEVSVTSAVSPSIASDTVSRRSEAASERSDPASPDTAPPGPPAATGATPPWDRQIAAQYGPTADDKALIFSAGERAVHACMTELGFPDYAEMPPPDYEAQYFDELSLDRDTFVAMAFLPPTTNFNPVSEAEQANVDRAAQDPGFEAALAPSEDGSSPGCRAEGELAAQGGGEFSFGQILAYLNNLDGEIVGRLRGGDAWDQLQVDWSACMAAAGFDFATRDDLQSIDWSTRPDAATAAGIDWDCRSDVAYLDRVSSAYQTEFDQMVGERQGGLVQVDAELDRIISYVKDSL